MRVGDLAKYMSRTVLVVDKDEDWVYGIELGETHLGKYRRSYINKSREWLSEQPLLTDQEKEE